jgi:hypothetical protein
VFLNISDYIESGIIERYLLGLATLAQEEELLYLRRIYPLLDVEITATELRFEEKLLEEGVPPPEKIKTTILHRINSDREWQDHTWRGYNAYEQTNRTTGYIPLEPFWNRRITVSIWWRCAFLAMAVLTMVLAASTWHFYQRATQLEDVLIKLKVSSMTTPAQNIH